MISLLKKARRRDKKGNGNGKKERKGNERPAKDMSEQKNLSIYIRTNRRMFLVLETIFFVTKKDDMGMETETLAFVVVYDI